MKKIFNDSDYRNLSISILKYLTIYELKTISIINKSVYNNLKYLYNIHENKLVINRIYNKRFFDKRFGKLYILSTNQLGPSSNLSSSKSFWKYYYPTIDEGDVVYIESCNKFITIQTNESLTVTHEFQDKKSFPLTFWQKIGKHYPYRLWINAKISIESLNYWRNKVNTGTIKNIKFLESDLSIQKPNELSYITEHIDVKIIYKDDLIYVYI